MCVCCLFNHLRSVNQQIIGYECESYFQSNIAFNTFLQLVLKNTLKLLYVTGGGREFKMAKMCLRNIDCVVQSILWYFVANRMVL